MSHDRERRWVRSVREQEQDVRRSMCQEPHADWMCVRPHGHDGDCSPRRDKPPVMWVSGSHNGATVDIAGPRGEAAEPPTSRANGDRS